MESRPSFSGRLNQEDASSSSSSSSSSCKSSIFGDHNLSSILNNPHSSRSSDASWLPWSSSSSSLLVPEFAPIPTPSASTSTPTRSDFLPYLCSISDHFTRFQDIRNHSDKESVGADQAGGDALVACLREVPSFYFKEDFQLQDGPTFLAACPFTTLSDNLALQNRLSHYLDLVEFHLLHEISLRSNSFFQAQHHLSDLSLQIVQGCQGISDLKRTIRLLDSDLVGTAHLIQDLTSTRSNLLSLHHKLRLIFYVNHALTALNLLVASSDTAAALDVADDLQHLTNGDELTGLHCFRHLRDHVSSSMDSINSILSAEFLRASLHDSGNLDAFILSSAKERASTSSNGKLDDIFFNEEESSYVRDCLLPITIGLLRTAKLPSVLRIYCETLTADMKTAIKTAVSELLPVLVARFPHSDLTTGERTADADGGGSSLAGRLRCLSTESFIQLLNAVFKIVLAHLVRAAEVKKSIEWIMSNKEGHYAAELVVAAIAHAAAATEDTESPGSSLAAYSTQRSATKVPIWQGKANDVTSQSSMSTNFRADVLRENAECVFAACDAAHGRWAKLLGVRAILHPKIRLQEFLSIYRITQEFINATERTGGRLGYSVRGTLQSQAKAFVDFQHESRAAKIKAVLDQETWSEVDVPDEFQTIVKSLLSPDLFVTGKNVGEQDGEVALRNGESTMSGSTNESAAEHPLEQTKSRNASNGIANLENCIRSSKETDMHRTDAATTSARNKSSNTKMIIYRGVEYHMVNCGLILLKMLSEYIDMNDSLPTLSAEIVHRVVEVLKFFNTRSCQLVLGAHAMQVSGLKSITSKHLALASQVISFVYAIIPDIRQVLLLKVPENRKMLLQTEMDHVAQDYKHHRDEIHSKLVQIMSERLLHHLRGLPQIVETWKKPDDDDMQPSHFAKSLTKEVNYLQRILSHMLHEGDLQRIFGQVVQTFHARISEAFSSLEITNPQAKLRLYRDIQQILGCIRSLPAGIESNPGVANWGQLDDFLAQRFAGEPASST